MTIGEAILRTFCRDPNAGDYASGNVQDDVQSAALSLLSDEFPQFISLIKGRRVTDFGCGNGKQSVAMVIEGAGYVYGIDTNPRGVSNSKQLASKMGIDNGKFTFAERFPSEAIGTMDFVISQNAMEHFPDPIAILNEMKSFIHKEGKIVITFGPPWFAPYGAHMQFFCRIPWLNMLFSERTVMKVRALYKSDGAMRYEEVESGLNKMTLNKFEKIVSQCGFVMQYKKYSGIKGQHWMSKIPFFRELLTNHVSCILALQQEQAMPVSRS